MNDFGRRVYEANGIKYKLKVTSIEEDEQIDELLGESAFNPSANEMTTTVAGDDIDKLLPVILVRLDGKPIEALSHKSFPKDELAHLMASFFLQKINQSKSMQESLESFAKLMLPSKRQRRK